MDKQSNSITSEEDITEGISVNEGHEELHVTEDLPEMKEYSGKTITIEIAAGAILGSLSIIIGFTWDAIVEGIGGGFGPSFAPGMTWIDFLAIPILVAFFVFGIRSGLIACIIGCGAIAGYLSEGGFGWLAMLPKFVASSTMFVVPWIVLKINGRRKRKDKPRLMKKMNYSSETFKHVGNYAFLMGNAVLFRMIITFAFNLFVVLPLYTYLVFGSPTFITVFDDPVTFLTLAGGYTAWNIVQGISDSIISYLIVYPTKLYKNYSTW
ncbi:MAG: hypothetical protein FK733_18610 [Asgard group archaeon]|nr:hypothetical protein [Asgard group archaeon]